MIFTVLTGVHWVSHHPTLDSLTFSDGQVRPRIVPTLPSRGPGDQSSTTEHTPTPRSIYRRNTLTTDGDLPPIILGPPHHDWVGSSTPSPGPVLLPDTMRTGVGRTNYGTTPDPSESFWGRLPRTD